jgi:regulator of protease activity HflC (stomatin/prohibitin superfamily)
VQAYVQWIVEDFKAAYQKLDFSDVDDPIRIVNVQLREQAEASIKDKLASLSIDEVLADRRPIIEELTARLRSVAEGQGLKIVQVQIKEAVVSSSVWENLQKPFREEMARLARMAELDRERAVMEREVRDNTEAERARILASSDTQRLLRAQEVELQRAAASSRPCASRPSCRRSMPNARSTPPAPKQPSTPTSGCSSRSRSIMKPSSTANA